MVAILGILFVTGVVFSHAFSKTKLGTSTVLADEEGSGGDSEDSHSSDSHSGDSHDSEDSHDSINNHDNSDENDQGDNQDEHNYTNTTRTRTNTQAVQQGDQEENDNEQGDEVENENENENDLQGEIKDLNDHIGRIESKISVLSANGVNTASFLSALAEIKDLVSQANAKLTSAPNEAETLIETADHKLERLNKLVKMTLGDDEEQDNENDATEKIQELTGEISKFEAKLNALSASGKDVSTLKSSLSSVKDLLSQAKDKATAGDLAGAEATAEMAEKKLETLHHAMELAYGDNEEGDEADEYKSEVSQFVHNLKDIGDIEGGIGKQVSVVAQAQSTSDNKVEESMKEVDDRSGFVKFLIGPKYGSIAEVQTAITENQTRIKVLTDLSNQVTDPAVKQVLQDQIATLTQQNATLQKFVAENEAGFSLFGWLMRIFA